MVDPNMRAVEGAGFPQDIFEKLKFVVPVVIYLDNALAHLFNDLQEVVMRLFGGRVVLGPPGTPLGRPEVESNIHRTRKCFDLQLPGALGSGPKDPLRQIADCPTEKLVHFNHYEQGLYCQLANENVSDSASAGYLDSFTRMKELLARGTFEPNYLPEHLREGYHFCAPKRLPVKCEITTSGRLPFILISPVDRRYSSKWLKANPPDGVREYWILQDYDDLRTAIICNDDMAYVDTLRCEGDWGRVPFDHRIQQIISRRSLQDPSQGDIGLSDAAVPGRRCQDRLVHRAGFLLFHELPEAHGDAGGVGCSADRIRQRRGAPGLQRWLRAADSGEGARHI